MRSPEGDRAFKRGSVNQLVEAARNFLAFQLILKTIRWPSARPPKLSRTRPDINFVRSNETSTVDILKPSWSLETDYRSLITDY